MIIAASIHQNWKLLIVKSIEALLIEGSGTERTVVCPVCMKKISRSLPPHMRHNHPEVWDQWCHEFVRLFNKGYSPKRIMRTLSNRTGPPFTWKVIEKEIKRIAEEDGIPLVARKKALQRWEPENFELERTSVWRFKKRGDWALHSGSYRGNWAPQVPRNLLLHYTREGDTVLDPFVGGGTTLIECRLLGRNSIGVDISPHALGFSRQRMNQMKNASESSLTKLPDTNWRVVRGDARNLDFLEDESIDFICGQPPYGDAIRYTNGVQGDLSRIHNLNTFYREMGKVGSELLRVLKKGKRCAILIGDIRRKKSIVPLGFEVMQRFMNSGFDLEEIIIKKQNAERSTETFYKRKYSQRRGLSELRFRIAHEYLFVFRKTEAS